MNNHLASALLALLLVLPSRCLAITYSLTELGSLRVAYAINNFGQVAAEGNSPSFLRAYSYGNPSLDLGTLGGTDSQAFGINASGRIVGRADTTNNDSHHAFFYDGSMHDLGTLGGSSSVAQAINTSGQIVGYSLRAGDAPNHAFLYDGTMHDLGELPGGTDSQAFGINSGGLVVGVATTNGSDGSRAFLYDGTMHDLGTLGGDGSVARGINDLGQVVGYSDTATNQHHAFLYDGTMHDIGTLPGGILSIATGINNGGQAVGYVIDPSAAFSSRAWLYHDGVVSPLDQLVDSSAAGWTLSQALSINDRGWIVGFGSNSEGYPHAFLLTPVPEPGTVALAASGGFIVVLILRRYFSLRLGDNLFKVVWRFYER